MDQILSLLGKSVNLSFHLILNPLINPKLKVMTIKISINKWQLTNKRDKKVHLWMPKNPVFLTIRTLELTKT